MQEGNVTLLQPMYLGEAVHWWARLTGSRGDAGGEWSAVNAVASWPRRERCCLYGSNDVAAGKPHLLKTTWDQLFQPMFVVQVRSDVAAYS